MSCSSVEREKAALEEEEDKAGRRSEAGAPPRPQETRFDTENQRKDSREEKYDEELASAAEDEEIPLFPAKSASAAANATATAA